MNTMKNDELNILLIHLGIIALLGFFVFLETAVKKSRDLRYKQRYWPFVAVIYGTVASCVLWAEWANLVNFLADRAAGNRYLTQITEYLANNVCTVLYVNCLVMISFLIIKIFILLFSGNTQKKQPDGNDQDHAYYYDKDYNKYFLKPQWKDFRKVFQAATVMYLVACGYYLAESALKYGTSPFYSLKIAPVIVLMFVAEMYSYLSGFTKTEYEYFVGGDASYSQSASAFFKLREVLEAMFAPNLLEARTGDEFSNQQAVGDYLRRMEEEETEASAKTSEYFLGNEGSKQYDVDYIRAMHNLMQGENVVIMNPFYRDLTNYFVLPLVNTLASDERVLVILGRNSAKEDVKRWIEELIYDFTKVESLWYVSDLKSYNSNCNVGLMTFNELYDIRGIENNRRFFDSTGLVLILEPSLVINTGQIGFSILSNQMKESGLSPVYCILDRMVEGLVDTMSHLLREKITEVVAPPVPRSIYTDMGWDADGDYMRQNLFEKQSRYFGSGFELAAVAVKNQIPHVSWISETKSPMRDLKWIVGQQFTSLCRYMNLPVNQNSIYEKIDFVPNLWSMERKRDQFIIVDDEFSNMFSTIRLFLSRGKNQVFVNVMSDNYLLRDYMRCNQQMFATNPNLIPSIVPDYAKTERNTLFKILYMMSYKPLSESMIQDELKLIHYPGDDVLFSLNQLIRRYSSVYEENLISVHTHRSLDGSIEGETEFMYSFSSYGYQKYLSRLLSNAYYIVEKENENTEYIDAKLFSQVTQTILPGQFVVYDGKYYIVHHISSRHGVILRRASDLYDRRLYYRQIRNYTLKKTGEEKTVSRRKIMDIILEIWCTNFSVHTTGYLEMNTSNDLRSARRVDFTGDPIVEEFSRDYKNKNILRICLPETTEHERFTICLLLMELFHSVFPNTWQYLACLTKRPDNIEGMLNYMVYEVDGDLDDDYIYILEDSTLDLGLIEAIEKNFMRFMEILSDYINWHFDKMREVEYKDPEPPNIIIPDIPDDGKRRNKLLQLLDRIRKLFGGKKEKTPEIKAPEDDKDIKEPASDRPEEESVKPDNTEEAADTPEYVLDDDEPQSGDPVARELPEEQPAEEETEPEPEPAEEEAEPDLEPSEEEAEPEPELSEEEAEPEELPAEENSDSDQGLIVKEEEDSDLIDIDGTDIFDTTTDAEHEEYFDNHFKAMGIDSIKETRYQRECYLKFGFDEIDHRIELDLVRKYLNARGWAKNSSVSLARTREQFLPGTFLYIDPENVCDFCGTPLTGISYDILDDGRIRCNNCTATAITTPEEFRELFQHTLGFMQSFYNINFKHTITVKTVDAATIARGAGMVFRPSTEFAARVLGYAQRQKNDYRLLVENGSPRLATVATMVHEMTHIWQYLNWNEARIRALYGNGVKRDIVYEGMAMWAEIQYLYLIGETSYAMVQEQQTRAREDIYGIGFNLFTQRYPLIKDASLVRNSPFKVFPPL